MVFERCIYGTAIENSICTKYVTRVEIKLSINQSINANKISQNRRKIYNHRDPPPPSPDATHRVPGGVVHSLKHGCDICEQARTHLLQEV